VGVLKLERKKLFRGDRLRIRRLELDLTQDELAAKLGFGSSQINKYENGKNDPTAEVLVRMANELRVSTDWLLGLTDEQTGSAEPKGFSPKVLKYLLAVESDDFKKVIAMALDEMNDK
jgi:transcriptional regulator with XRE-family HTH domain